MGGDASLWESKELLDGQASRLVNQFDAQVAGEYVRILKALKGRTPDLAALSRQYQHALSLDYFRSSQAEKVRAALLRANGGIAK
jgi:hypothetical protein